MTEKTTTELTAAEKEFAALKDEPSITIILDDDGKGEGVKEDDDAKQAIEQLRRKLQEEQREKAQWQAQAYHSNHLAFENAAENARRDYASLADKLKDALERYDGTEAADIQLKLAERARQIQDLDQAVRRTSQPLVDPRTQQEQFLATQDRWNREIIEAHRDKFFGDKSIQARMIAASNHAVHNLGLRTDDARYRDFVEREAGLKPITESRRSSHTTTTAAPPSRYVPGTKPNSSRITLDRAQRDHARFLYPDSKDPDTAYAQRILADYRAGLCDEKGKYYQR